MSYEEEQKTLTEIIQHLPQRVKVADADDAFLFSTEDVIVLEIASSIKIVKGTNRITDKEIRIPYHYQRDVHLPGKPLSSVEEIQNEQFTWFSVEKPFETPVSPWLKKTVPSGSVVELTDIEYNGGIVVRLGEDPVYIPETTPLYFKAVSDEKYVLERIIEQHGLPQDIVIKDDDGSDDSFICSRFPPGNYRLTDVDKEEFIFGYTENFSKGNAEKRQFIIATSSNILVRQEITSPQTRQPYKNAFFVPKHLYDSKKSSELFLQYEYGGDISFKINDESVPELPPRTKIRPQVHRASLKVNGSDSAVPIRPERRPKQRSDVSDDAPPRPASRLSSFEENQNEDLSRQTVAENQLEYNLGNLEVTNHHSTVPHTPSQYMALNPETGATSGHVYDVMQFEESENQARNVSNPSNSKSGVFHRCFKCLKPEGQSTSVHDMSVSKLVALLNEYGLSQMAVICSRNKLDGAFVSDLSIEQLTDEPFNLNDEQVDIVMNLIAKTD